MQIQIQPSAMIRRNYNEVARICREEGTPVFLSKNGEDDLVAIAVEQYCKREQQILLRERLVEIEKRRRAGVKDFPAQTVRGRLGEMIENYKLLELTQESEYPEGGRESLRQHLEPEIKHPGRACEIPAPGAS